MARCENCGQNLGKGERFTIKGTEGQWRGKNLFFCDAQCLIESDCSGPPPHKGNQGFNLEKDLGKLRPRR